MKKSDIRKLIKIDEFSRRFVEDELGLKTNDVEFDIVPVQKMLELLAYRGPVNISNWKYGRDYERLRTIHENWDPGLPYELVVPTNPARAYLMNTNTLGIHTLVITHVYGHTTMFKESRYYREIRDDFFTMMVEANKRLYNYEKRFGVKEVEKIVDAGHALQFHSSPFDNETEEDKRKRIFEQQKLKEHSKSQNKSEYGDLTSTKNDTIVDVELYNERLWRSIKLRTPPEPTEDLLRYIIDNSRMLEDWQKDILEILREEGRHFWAHPRSRHLSEGWAIFVQEKICKALYDEGLIDDTIRAQIDYSNSLVKAQSSVSMNPYLVGSEILKDIEERWNKGRYGTEWENCTSAKEKENWDKKEGKGWEKCVHVIRTYLDWFFMQDFLTTDLIDKIDLYIYRVMDMGDHYDLVRTEHTAEEIREMIVNSFAHSGIPKIEIVDGNYDNKGQLLLEHRWAGADLDVSYAKETMKHIYNLWGFPTYLKTKIDDKPVRYVVDKKARKRPDVGTPSHDNQLHSFVYSSGFLTDTDPPIHI